MRGHAYVVRTADTCGGRARIDGTRIPVWLVVGAVVRGGQTAEEFVDAYPSVTVAQVYDAISYYYDHRDEVDGDIADQAAAWP